MDEKKLMELAKLGEEYKRLADEERIVVLPCPFGTTVYYVQPLSSTAKQHYNKTEKITHFSFGPIHIDKIPYFGEKYFLTESAALQEIARRRDERWKKYQKELIDNITIGTRLNLPNYGVGTVEEVYYDSGIKMISVRAYDSDHKEFRNIKYQFDKLIANSEMTVITGEKK